MRTRVAGSAARSEQAPLSLAGARIHPGDEAARAALSQLDFGEASQVGILGDTGCGKSEATKRLIALYKQKSAGSIFIVDDKDLSTKFEGQQRRDVQDLAEHPIDWQQGRVTVFRGDVARGVRCNLDEVAEVAWIRVGRARKTLCVWDELVAGREDLCKNGQWRRGVTWLPRSFTMGRSPGIANIWGAQSPQDVPRECFEQAGAILCFRLAGLGLNRLKERNYLAGGADEVIPLLPGPPRPPHERGLFVLLIRGQPWDQKLYRFELKAAA